MISDAPDRWSRMQRWLVRLVALLLLLFAIEVLKTGVGVLAPSLRTWLPVLVRGDLSALGTSWLAAYLLLNGSAVAAFALTLFNEGLLEAPQLLLMIFGSRLGAAGIVLLLGLFDVLQQRTLTARRASELGTLTFLVTHTVGIPAMLLARLWMHGAPFRHHFETTDSVLRALPMPSFVERMADTLLVTTGPLAGIVMAIGLLMGSLRLFHAVFSEADVERLRERFGHALHSRWWAFGVGMGLTALTTSIALSLGVIVPIYNRGLLRRREIIPYILGANIGTLLDTVLISLFIERAGGAEVVLLTMAMTVGMTLLPLVLMGLYRALMDIVLKRIVSGRWAFLLFLLSLLLAPLALITFGW